MNALIEAFDRMRLSARNDLTQLPGSSMTGINGEKAQLVYLRACDTMTLEGAITAQKLIIC